MISLATVYPTGLSLANGPQGGGQGGQVRRRAQVLVNRLDGDRARPHRGGHPLDQPVPDVARCEDARNARLHGQRRASERPSLRAPTASQEVRPAHDVAALVASYILGQPARKGPGTDEGEQGCGADGLGGVGDRVLEYEAFEPPASAAVHEPGVQADLNVVGGLQLPDQVVPTCWLLKSRRARGGTARPVLPCLACYREYSRGASGV